MDDEIERLLAERKTLRARQLSRERSGSARSRITGFAPAAIFVAVVAATGALFYAAAKIASAALDTAAPTALGYVLSFAAPILTSPAVLAFVGAAILILGLPHARRFRRPNRFRAGIVALGLAVVTFWPMQFVASGIEVSFREWRLALHLMAGFVSVCLLTGGIELIRRADHTPRDDSWEFLR